MNGCSLSLGKLIIILSFQMTCPSLSISIAKAAGEISGNSSMFSWLPYHKDFEQSFVPASKTKLAKKTAPIWEVFYVDSSPP
jgi:hypothetical protein